MRERCPLVLVGGALVLTLVFTLRLRGASPVQLVALSLLTGGGLGNLIDRLIHDGAVVDFVSIGVGALRTGAPIVPVAVVGSEEVRPVIFEARSLARLFGLPTAPVTLTFPWLGLAGLVPLPSKWFIAFGKPIDVAHFGPDAADNSRLVLELSEEVREWIQGTLRELLPRRRTIFF